jgi:hypothetical protein
LGRTSRRSDALKEQGKSTPQAREANTPCASHTFIFGTFTSFNNPLDRLRIVVVGDEVGILVVGLELGLAVVGVEVGIVVVGEREGLLVVGLRVGAVVGSQNHPRSNTQIQGKASAWEVIDKDRSAWEVMHKDRSRAAALDEGECILRIEWDKGQARRLKESFLSTQMYVVVCVNRRRILCDLMIRPSYSIRICFLFSCSCFL